MSLRNDVLYVPAIVEGTGEGDKKTATIASKQKAAFPGIAGEAAFLWSSKDAGL
jgi:hypothetical protein